MGNSFVPCGSSRNRSLNDERRWSTQAIRKRSSVVLDVAFFILPGRPNIRHSHFMPVRVLLVEDSRAEATLIQTNTARSAVPVEIAVADDGLAALARLATFKPDLIISDLVLPRTPGTGLLGRPKTNGIPIVIFSSSVNPTDANVDNGAYLRCRAITTILPTPHARNPIGPVTNAPSSPHRLPAVGDEHAKATPTRYPAIPPVNDANTTRKIFMYDGDLQVIDTIR
jgi:CheY-like chemotaxis protein